MDNNVTSIDVPIGTTQLSSGSLNHEPFIRQFLMSRHIAFHRTPDLLRYLISYFTLSDRWALATFVPIILVYFIHLGFFSADFNELHTKSN